MSEPQWITELKSKCETQCRIQEYRRDIKFFMNLLEVLNSKLLPLIDELDQLKRGKK